MQASSVSAEPLVSFPRGASSAPFLVVLARVTLAVLAFAVGSFTVRLALAGWSAMLMPASVSSRRIERPSAGAMPACSKAVRSSESDR